MCQHRARQPRDWLWHTPWVSQQGSTQFIPRHSVTIDDNHMYHGAALIQIAEAPQFTAINSLTLDTGVCRSAYRVNDTIGVYLKYASKPKGALEEYQFNFLQSQLDEIVAIADVVEELFIALVCVHGREICLLTFGEVMDLVEYRHVDAGHDEDQYTILVTMPPRKAFRVYVNAAGERNRYAGEPLVIARNLFPKGIFE